MHPSQAIAAAPSVASPAVTASNETPASAPLLANCVSGMANADVPSASTQVLISPPSLAPTTRPSGLPAPLCTLVTKVAPLSVTNQASKVMRGPRMSAPPQIIPPKTTQTTIQLPANFQIPPGTVLIRSGNGQLMLVSQQALARAQAQVQNNSIARLPASTSITTVQCAKQTMGAKQLSNVTNTIVKTTSSAPVTLPPVLQRTTTPVLQPATVTNNIAGISSPVSVRPNTSVSGPTIVKICTPPVGYSAAAGTSQGAPAVLIRSSAPTTTAVSTSSCTLAGTITSTSATLAATLGIKTSSEMGTSTKSITVLPVKSSVPLATPIKVTSGTPIVLQSAAVAPSSSALTTTQPAIVNTSTSSSTSVIQTSSPSVKLTTANICDPTTARGTQSPPIKSSIMQSSPTVTSIVSGNNVPSATPVQVQANHSTAVPSVVSNRAEPSKVSQKLQTTSSTEVLDNVKKCKNFLATLIKLASSGQSPTMGENVKNLVKSLLDSEVEPEEFTTKLYAELKSSPQPYLVPFLKKSLPALRKLMPSSQSFIMQCGQQIPTTKVTMANSVSVVKITPTTLSQSIKQIGTTTLGSLKVQQTSSSLTQPINTLKPMNFKQLVVQQPTGGIVKHVTALQQASTLNAQKPGEKRISLNALIQASHLSPASILKPVSLPGNKVISLQAHPIPVKENVTACFREEDDINDVTSMAGVNLNEENACILATNSEIVGAVIRSCKEEPFLFTTALHNRILDIGKRHDINELNSDVMNLVSHATQERLRGLIEKLTVAAQHRFTNWKNSDRYIKSTDVKAQLKFLEQLEHLEKQRKYEEEREMLLRAAKSRSNKEDPEQLRLKQKAKEMQQMELEQIQYREANLTALAAIGPRRKRPLDSVGLQSGLEEFCTSGSAGFGFSKSLHIPRITRVSLKDLIYCMEQEKETRHSLSLYRAFLK
ncbi:transcription initiation factor TFIID subunit 4B [Bombina bombina]|uniref:transcription initiation factor TFIID subunit 4B n=1 Tax=Bombina bombina TaxID=8345 RepID=UPI00235A7991|nr:transcription initiation factor TFIID subunit 4B [Bombina bombina]